MANATVISDVISEIDLVLCQNELNLGAGEPSTRPLPAAALAQFADATVRTAQAEQRADAAQQRAEAAIASGADRAEYRADELPGPIDELEVNLERPVSKPRRGQRPWPR
jgi:hypothetical protein